MKKVAVSMITLGLAFVGMLVFDLKEALILILLKAFEINPPLLNNDWFYLILGSILIGLGIILYFYDNEKDIIMEIIGLDKGELFGKIKKQINTIDIKDNIKKLNIKNADKFIKSIDSQIEEGIIKKFCNSGISYYGVAPIPIIAFIGTLFSKVNIVNYYEYQNYNNSVYKLNNSIFYRRLKTEISSNSKASNAVITVELTANIEDDCLEQFNECELIRNQVCNAKDNKLRSKLQLNNYSEKICNEVYELSKHKNIKTIYILFACQSSLAFDVCKKINQRRVKEIISCHYVASSTPKYRWGIIIGGPNIGKYIEFVGGDSNGNK